MIPCFFLADLPAPVLSALWQCASGQQLSLLGVLGLLRWLLAHAPRRAAMPVTWCHDRCWRH